MAAPFGRAPQRQLPTPRRRLPTPRRRLPTPGRRLPTPERRRDRRHRTPRLLWSAIHAFDLWPCCWRLPPPEAFSAVLLPTGLFPVVQFPRILINVDAGARPADQTVLLLTIPLEQAVREVPGVINMRSTTSRGSAEISLDFPLGYRHGGGDHAGGCRGRANAARASVGCLLSGPSHGPNRFPHHRLLAHLLTRSAPSRSATWCSTRSCHC